jgi:hypothetical protein
MVSSSHPYRDFAVAVTPVAPPDPLRNASRIARVFVLLVAVTKLGTCLAWGLDDDAWVAVLVVAGAAVSLAPRSERS